MEHIHRHGNNLVILHCVDLSTMSGHGMLFISVINNIRNTVGSMRATVLTGYYTDQGQYDGQGVYHGLSTASYVFLIFTTKLKMFMQF